MSRRVAIGGRPQGQPDADRWIRHGDGAGKPGESRDTDRCTARLTVDVTPALRGRIKVAAFRKGLTVADMLRVLYEREFPDTEGTP
jgi:hypothetical protein